jgi:hypothetical protein
MPGQEQALEEGCRAWMTERRWGIHDLMVRLKGRCVCQSSTEHVTDLYGIDGTRREDLVSA